MDHFDGVDSVRSCRIQNGQLDKRVIKPAELQNPKGFSDAGCRRGEISYVLHALGKYVFADQTLAFFDFGLVQPGDTLVQKVAERFRSDCFANGRRHADGPERHRGSVAQEAANDIERVQGRWEMNESIETHRLCVRSGRVRSR